MLHWTAYALKIESSLPSLSFRAVGGLCLEISLGMWGPGPVSVSTFCDTEQVVISDQKKYISRNGSGSHVPRETSTPRPPTALKLGSDDSQLSGAYALQVWW